MNWEYFLRIGGIQLKVLFKTFAETIFFRCNYGDSIIVLCDWLNGSYDTAAYTTPPYKTKNNETHWEWQLHIQNTDGRMDVRKSTSDITMIWWCAAYMCSANSNQSAICTSFGIHNRGHPMPMRQHLAIDAERCASPMTVVVDRMGLNFASVVLMNETQFFLHYLQNTAVLLWMEVF